MWATYDKDGKVIQAVGGPGVRADQGQDAPVQVQRRGEQVVSHWPIPNADDRRGGMGARREEVTRRTSRCTRPGAHETYAKELKYFLTEPCLPISHPLEIRHVQTCINRLGDCLPYVRLRRCHRAALGRRQGRTG